jgi:hypothetical protein
MNLDWQNLSVLLLVSAAGGYLARVAWRSMARREATTCGGCSNCSDKSGGPQVVALDALSRNAQTVARPAAARDPGR